MYLCMYVCMYVSIYLYISQWTSQFRIEEKESPEAVSVSVVDDAPTISHSHLRSRFNTTGLGLTHRQYKTVLVCMIHLWNIQIDIRMLQILIEQKRQNPIPSQSDSTWRSINDIALPTVFNKWKFQTSSTTVLSKSLDKWLHAFFFLWEVRGKRAGVVRAA